MNHLARGALLAVAVLAGCGPVPPRLDQAAQAGPHGIIAAGPPADTSFTPLRCVPNGPGTDCTRKP